MTTLRIKLLVWLAVFAFGGAMAAQSIAPPIAEYRGAKADGMFEIKNTTDYSMAVVLETRSFAVDDHGQVRYRPLDPGIQIKMGASSFVLRAHDSRMIFYKATFPSAPASVSIMPTMTKAGVVEGVRVNYILPHMIYVYQKVKFQRSDVKVQLADGLLQIQNLSTKLGRIESVEAPKQDLGGFPLYPGQTRQVALSGDKASVTFEDGFKVNVP
jgi:hypothetical protein